MKAVKFLFVALLCLVMAPATSFADDFPVPVDQLPLSVKEFVQNYFPELTIIYAERDNEMGGKKIRSGDSISTHRDYYAVVRSKLHSYSAIKQELVGNLTIGSISYKV